MFKIEDYICISREIGGGGGGLVAKSFLTLLRPYGLDCSGLGTSNLRSLRQLDKSRIGRVGE